MFDWLTFLSKKMTNFDKNWHFESINQFIHSINSFIQLIHSFNLFIGYCLIDFFNQKMTYFDKNWHFHSFIHSFIHWLFDWLIIPFFDKKVTFIIDWLTFFTKKWQKIAFLTKNLLLHSSFIHWELIDWLKNWPFLHNWLKGYLLTNIHSLNQLGI